MRIFFVLLHCEILLLPRNIKVCGSRGCVIAVVAIVGKLRNLHVPSAASIFYMPSEQIYFMTSLCTWDFRENL